ncbi:hypothetical protein [Paenibacillus polymyxa]|uniref:hypothetical protein n=1 Tax=Paenibacillus polymyxa TaxID=1406 RepID=UPI002AB359E2|nr:hypothetical protein [Paenibacillus polymyxa]MDY8025664.1 hypothetical protein [Paenibacillus polymyxa]
MMNTDLIKQFAIEHDCFNKSISGFWNYVNSWKIEEPEEFYEAFNTFDLSSLVLEKWKIALVVNYRYDEPIQYVQTMLNVVFQEKSFAEYRLLQKLNGDVMDDGLSFN